MKKVFTATFVRTIEANGKYHSVPQKRRVRGHTYGDALARIRKLFGYEVSDIHILPFKKKNIFSFLKKKK